MRYLTLFGLGFLILSTTMPADAQSSERWLPEACTLALRTAPGGTAGEERLEARWNRAYRLGIDALETEDFDAAERHFCRALDAARTFEPDDIRFAETLDELGLLNYLRGDYAAAEAMQGAAAVEIFLALGPPAEDLRSAAEKSCKSSVATYLVRLGWTLERQGRGEEIERLLDEPYRLLGRGYVPWERLRPRLDSVIAQYLLDEDFTAADWLSALRDELR